MESTTKNEKPAIEIFAELAVKAGWNYNELQLSDIAEIIKNLNEAQISGLCKSLRMTKRWAPKVSEVNEAKIALTGENTQVSPINIVGNAREELISKIIYEYLVEFNSSEEAKIALREGYGYDLMKFAEATASTMARMIHGYQATAANGRTFTNWGWDQNVVPREYIDEYYRQLQTNFSKVKKDGINIMLAMPGGVIPAWKKYNRKEAANF